MVLPIAALSLAVAQVPADTMIFRRIEVAPAESVSIGSIGSGPPVIIVPGMLGSAFSFRAVIGPIAAEGYRVIVIDPLGTGLSGAPEKADYSLSAQAVRIGAAAHAIDVDRAVFLCHSVSSAICLRLAYESPDLVAGIVSINGGAAERQATPGLRFALKVASVIRFIAGDGWARGKVKDGLRNSSADPAWVTDEIVRAYTGYFGGMGSALSTLKRMANSEEPAPLAPLLPGILSPVVLLLGGGTKDGLPPADEMKRLATIPRFEVDTVAAAGQYVQEEQPDAVISSVVEMARGVLRQPLMTVPELRTTLIRIVRELQD
jgi:pimeloyl-ACP methyl ester carboxylesterase